MGGEKLPLTCSQSYPKMALSDLISQTQSFVSESHASGAHGKHGVVLKSVLTGLLSGVAPPPLVVRMCPPLTTKNWNVYTPLLALGEMSFSACLMIYAGNFELLILFCIIGNSLKYISPIFRL